MMYGSPMSALNTMHTMNEDAAKNVVETMEKPDAAKKK
jgi:hypothetical protein